MAGETTITVIGNLTDDPELRFTPSGAAVANFTIASTPRTFNKTTNAWEDGDPLFFNCAVWRDAAEHVVESLFKGVRVIASGQLQIRNYERKDGSKGTSVDLVVDAIGPELRWASAKVTRAERGGPAASSWGSGSTGTNTPAATNNPWSTGPAAQPTQGTLPDEPPF